MPDPRSMSRPAQMRLQAYRLLDLADEDEQESRSIVRSERIIADVEQIATDVRAIVRGAAAAPA